MGGAAHIQSSKNSIRGAWIWLTVLTCIPLAMWLWNSQWTQPWLTVRNQSGEKIFSTPLPPEQEFGIRFVHSVALSPVEEWFTAEEGLLALRRTVYQDFGAGLPHEAGEGQRMSFTDGRIVLSGFTLKLAQIDVRVGRVAGHELLLSDAKIKAGTQPVLRTLPLAAWAAPGTALSFTMEIPSLWTRLKALF